MTQKEQKPAEILKTVEDANTEKRSELFPPVEKKDEIKQKLQSCPRWD